MELLTASARFIINPIHVFLLTAILTHPVYGNQSIDRLPSLDLNSEGIKSLRTDIRKSIYIIKSRRDPKTLPALRFYRYRVREGDSFWKILTNTSQNIDTLMTVNSLGSAGEINPGEIIYIPNMRGIIIKVGRTESIEKIADRYNVGIKYIESVNSLNENRGRYLFIPCGEISRLERSLFLGTGFRNPLRQGRKTSGFGTRRDPFNSKRLQFHRGIDIACPQGTPVYPARNGKVTYCGYEGGYGLMVKIQHRHGYYSYYGHLSRITVKKGQYVKTGQRIAFSGNTGRTTGPHLHFEVRKGIRAINPGILFR